ncbi:hypothetical protein [Succinimonas sp.]|uniref:hypothetical protein n=1 Tax=Succinimonas sp. TaxID=1936151 RepID=UPI00386C955C
MIIGARRRLLRRVIIVRREPGSMIAGVRRLLLRDRECRLRRRIITTIITDEVKRFLSSMPH